MSNTPDDDENTNLFTGQPRKRSSLLSWLRGRFLAGIVVAAPIGITVFLVWKFIEFVDSTVKPLIPDRWNPETYTQFALPGLGLVFAVVGLILIGTIAANLLGKSLLNVGDWLIGRVPFVRSIHMTLKQVISIFTSGQSRSFREVVMVEYPRKNSWAIGFVTSEVKGELAEKTPGMVGVFVPTTPNPTSGFLIYVDRSETKTLNMSVEEGAKLIISAGLVVPEPAEPEMNSDNADDFRSKVSRLLPSFDRKTGSE
ncbi:MAG: hypothetical protein CME88_16630 [Hirschia sp.]|nr:hypothetical protein [Hirschia sp.]MBF20003.1 hypothetical protein [Hirschia sp.]